MNQSNNKATHFCGCCRQELPIENFYIIKKTQHPDNYCKECRKNSSRTQRINSNRSRIENSRRNYPVITEIHNRTLRIELIRHAQQVVSESTERKRKKMNEKDLSDFKDID